MCCSTCWSPFWWRVSLKRYAFLNGFFTTSSLQAEFVLSLHERLNREKTEESRKSAACWANFSLALNRGALEKATHGTRVQCADDFRIVHSGLQYRQRSASYWPIERSGGPIRPKNSSTILRNHLHAKATASRGKREQTEDDDDQLLKA